MSVWLTTTSFSDLLVRFFKGGTSSSDTAGVNIVSAQMERAEAVVMSALAARYSMPFTTVPPEVRRIAQDIASYMIIRASNWQDGKEKNRMLEEFKVAFEDLKAIASGDMKLTLTDGSLLSVKADTRMTSSTINYTPIFGKDDPTNWERDIDEINDEASARA